MFGVLGYGSTADAEEGCALSPARHVVDKLVAVENDDARAVLDAWQARDADAPLYGFYALTMAWAEVEAEWNDRRRQLMAQEVSDDGAAYVERIRTMKVAPEEQLRQRLALGLGQALTAKAALEAGEYLRAYRYGRAGRDTLRDLVASDPTQADAYYVLGLYELYTGSLPGYLRWLTNLFDLSGDVDRGLEYLERAVREAPNMAPEAARFLLVQVMSVRQPQVCRYWPLARQARQRYPGNPQFALALGALASQCGRQAEGLADLQKARRQFADEPRLGPYFDQLEFPLREASADITWFENHPPASPGALPRWRLGYARSLDAAGKRDQARQEYSAIVRDHRTPGALRQRAESGLWEPYQPPAPVDGDPSLRMQLCLAEPETTAGGDG